MWCSRFKWFSMGLHKLGLRGLGSKNRLPEAVFAFCAKALAALALSTATLAHAIDIMVPAYFYPGGGTNYWDKLRDTQLKLSGTSARIVAIFNPNNGPTSGSTAEPAFVTALTEFKKAGGKVLAYIHTSYAARPLNDVTNDVAIYQRQYANGTLDLIDGYFVDEMTSVDNGTYVDYYRRLYSYIKQFQTGRYLVVGNPGTVPAERYVRDPVSKAPSGVADQLIVFESAASQYSNFRLAAWQKQVDPKTFVHLLYGASQAQMTAAFNKAGTNWFGSIFVTSDDLPNPWDTLPMGYWDMEVQKAASTAVLWPK